MINSDDDDTGEVVTTKGGGAVTLTHQGFRVFTCFSVRVSRVTTNFLVRVEGYFRPGATS